LKHPKELLRTSAKQHPDRVFLSRYDGKSKSYEETYRDVSASSELLREHSIGPGSLVGWACEKSPQSVIHLLGILEGGCAYLSLDPDWPVPRIRQILDDAEPAALWVETENTTKFLPLSFEVLVEVGAFALLGRTEANRAMHSDLACLLYTSGSTGSPKGVMVSPLNILAFVDWCASAFSLGEDDVVLSIAPLHFDLSLFDLFATCRAGGRVVLCDKKQAQNPRLLSSLMQESGVTTCYSTPTFFQLMLRHGQLQTHTHSKLARVLFAGEVFPADALQELRQVWNHARFFNLYGPTETNVCTFFSLPTDPSIEVGPVPIGQPCDHAEIVVDWDERDTGELLVSGPTVSRGYWKLPDKSFIHRDGKRFYKTGDWVSRLDDGNLVFLGRRDRMVKRRGFRIELHEIEAVLASHKNIDAAAVVAETSDVPRIKAFYSSKDALPPTQIELRQFCLGHLPRYMLPDTFECLDKLPVNSHHKIEYSALLSRRKG
jgi:amino acid adenylation domain-containing protein